MEGSGGGKITVHVVCMIFTHTVSWHREDLTEKFALLLENLLLCLKRSTEAMRCTHNQTTGEQTHNTGASINCVTLDLGGEAWGVGKSEKTFERDAVANSKNTGHGQDFWNREERL